MKRTTIVALTLATGALPAVGQETEAPSRESSPPIAASAWCTVHDGDRGDSDPGCDVGVGAALYTWDRLSLVALLGADTLGPGLAWVVYRPEDGPIVAVGAAVVAPYDGDGIHGDEVVPVLGATLGFGREEP